jgi:hypothetical protein
VINGNKNNAHFPFLASFLAREASSGFSSSKSPVDETLLSKA